jgi:hypothetical protein
MISCPYRRQTELPLDPGISRPGGLAAPFEDRSVWKMRSAPLSTRCSHGRVDACLTVNGFTTHGKRRGLRTPADAQYCRASF